MVNSQLIRVGIETKGKLEELKVIKEEPMTKVLERLILTFEKYQKLIEELDIDENTIRELTNRTNNVKKGNVMSEKEMREKLFGKK